MVDVELHPHGIAPTQNCAHTELYPSFKKCIKSFIPSELKHISQSDNLKKILLMYNLSKLYLIKKIIDGALHRGCFFKLWFL